MFEDNMNETDLEVVNGNLEKAWKAARTLTDEFIFSLIKKFNIIDAFTVASNSAPSGYPGINWHECSSYLNRMKEDGKITLIGHDVSGMCQYSINKER